MRVSLRVETCEKRAVTSLIFQHFPFRGIRLVLNTVGRLIDGIVLLTAPMWPIEYSSNRMSCEGRCSNICNYHHVILSSLDH